MRQRSHLPPPQCCLPQNVSITYRLWGDVPGEWYTDSHVAGFAPGVGPVQRFGAFHEMRARRVHDFGHGYPYIDDLVADSNEDGVFDGPCKNDYDSDYEDGRDEMADHYEDEDHVWRFPTRWYGAAAVAAGGSGSNWANTLESM